MTRMKVITSHFCLILTGSILLTGLPLLTGWLECCGPSELPQPQVAAVRAGDARTPTLAPPLQLVFVHVESDMSDLEVGWQEN
jgi:hypothetical protein